MAVGLLLAVATLAPGAAWPHRAEASSTASAPASLKLARAHAIQARLDARHRPAFGLAVTEATSTAVLESYSLLTPDLAGTRVVDAANGIYYAICPVGARCPFPAARYARPAAEIAPRRLALEIALRTFLETSADLVVVSLPTVRFVAFVVERAELAREVDLRALSRALGGDPSRPLGASLEGLVDRLTRPRIFVALGLEPTVGGRTSWTGVPQWPAAPEGGERALLATSPPRPIRFELDLEGVQGRVRTGKVLAVGSGSHPEGTFRSQTPYCAGGRVVELRRGLSGRWITADRRFTCADGSGSVTARMWLMGMDEGAGLEDGVWRIVEGTGAYATLRGMGAYNRALVDAGNGPTSHEEWAGDADFDAVPPRVAISAVSPGSDAAPDGSHVVRVALTAVDRAHPVDFIVSARNHFLLAAKTGRTLSGVAAVALRVRPGTGGRRIRLKVEATDRVGNTSTVFATVVLPD